jgi:hypothetical protein
MSGLGLVFFRGSKGRELDFRGLEFFSEITRSWGLGIKSEVVQQLELGMEESWAVKIPVELKN